MKTLAHQIRIVLEGKQDTVTGTNCGNCKFFTGKKAELQENLNEQGGVKSPDAEHLALAKKGDLITLPGDAKPTDTRMCAHKEIDQFVNDRMCCAYWDNPGAYREFKK